MSINSKNDSNKRQESTDKKSPTPVEKTVSETKKKAHDAQNGKK